MKFKGHMALNNIFIYSTIDYGSYTERNLGQLLHQEVTLSR